MDSPFIPPELMNGTQLIFISLVYAYILKEGSELISDGSELLLLVPSMAGIVGSVVLPVLGAVPDGMMVLFSGVGDDAAKQIYVGVGTLCGSTVMLLTIAWWCSILGGRVNIGPKGKPMYHAPPNWPKGKEFEKLSPPTNMSSTGTGVQVKSEIKQNAKYMLATCMAFVVVQCGSVAKTTMSDEEAGNNIMKWSIFAGLAMTIIGFCLYLKAMLDGESENEAIEGKTVEAIQDALKSGEMSLEGALGEVQSMDKKYSRMNTPLMETDTKAQAAFYRKLGNILKPYFKKYDVNGDGVIDFEEFRVICTEVSHSASRDLQFSIFQRMDLDNSGTLEFDEFVDCMLTLSRKAAEYEGSIAGNRSPTLRSSSDVNRKSSDLGELMRDSNMNVTNQQLQTYDKAELTMTSSDDSEADDDDEEDEPPDDLAHLSPEEQQKRIKMRAAWRCGVGTLLILVFSDPMVDVLQEMSDRIGVNSFFVSFILSPLVSNASELIAAYNYAQKRTMKTITISLSTLEGAAVMNNTFCLGIFLYVVLVDDLEWSFTCETISMLLVEFAVFWYAYTKEVHKMMDAWIILSLYPACLLFVFVGKNILGYT